MLHDISLFIYVVNDCDQFRGQCFRSRWQDAHDAKRSLLELLAVFNLYLSLLLQEEEIPELEIDIDELLELEDEGQRTRLQVMLCRTTLTPSLGFIDF